MGTSELKTSAGLGFLLGAGPDCRGGAHPGKPGALRRMLGNMIQ